MFLGLLRAEEGTGSLPNPSKAFWGLLKISLLVFTSHSKVLEIIIIKSKTPQKTGWWQGGHCTTTHWLKPWGICPLDSLRYISDNSPIKTQILFLFPVAMQVSY